MGDIIQMRRTILPKEIFELIEGYMMGDYDHIQVIVHHSAGRMTWAQAGHWQEGECKRIGGCGQ